MMKSEEELHELGRFLMNTTGTFNRSASGMTPFMHSIEAGLVSYAALYRRATFAMVAKSFRGGPVGQLAREALVGPIPDWILKTATGKQARYNYSAHEFILRAGFGNLLGAATSFGVMAYLLGNKDVFDPTKPAFMAVKVGDDYIGIGTAYYSATRTVASISRHVMDALNNKNDRELSDFLRLDPRDNTLLKWWRSQSSPLSGSALDLLTKSTYIGEPLTGDDGSMDWPKTVKHLGAQMLPFWWDSLGSGIEATTEMEFRFEPTGAEIFGFRTFPASMFEKRSALRQHSMISDTELAEWRNTQGDKELSWKNLPVLEQKRLVERHEDLQELDAEIEKTNLNRHTLSQGYAKYSIAQRQNREQLAGEYAKAGAGFRNGTYSGRQFGEQLQKIGAVNRGLSIRLQNDPRFAEVTNDLKERNVSGESSAGFEGDIRFSEYMQTVLLHPDVLDADQNFVPSEFQRLDNQFRRVYGEEIYKYVQARRRDPVAVPSEVQEYWDARDDLRDYWSLEERLFSKGSRARDLIQNWRRITNEVQKRLALQADPQLNLALRRLHRGQIIYRRNNPEMDWLLVKYYDNAPKTKFAQVKFDRWYNRASRA
jgi:hypothetical protein